uniref:MARVEL domain-containing protein n=1 Tax=Amphimedon queenslandica TaxID=400682 RepID=A0A1X7U438_AMPQE
MPEIIKQILSVVPLAVLLLSLGAAGISLGLLQANTDNGLSIASATIATICLALLTAIELISVSFQIYVKRLIANIIQAGFFVGSILFLFITMIVVSAGWGKTCATYRNITSSGGTSNSAFNIDCTGPQYISDVGPFAPNGADFITAAVFAGVGAVSAIGAFCYLIVKLMRRQKDDNEATPKN